MRLEHFKGLHSLEGIEGVEGLERLEPRYWEFGCFFQFLTLKEPRNTKIGLEKEISYINIIIIVNKLQYINSYFQLKYGLLIIKSLYATR